MSQNERVILPSFGAGELSPALFARVDLAKYKVGLALCRNTFVDYRGGASNRAGTQYLATSATAAPLAPRIIPFIVSTLNSYVIELGNNYATFYQNGTVVQANLATPWAIADIAALKYSQSASVLTVVHPNYPPYDIKLTNTTFSIVEQVYGPQMVPPTDLQATATGGGGTDYYHGYVVTAVSADGTEESLPTFPTIVASPTLGVNNQIKVTWTPPSVGVSKYNVYGWGGESGYRGDNPPSAVFGFITSTLGPSFSDNGTLTPDFTKLPPQFNDPFSPGQIVQAVVASGGTQTVAYDPLIVTDSTGSGASGYAVSTVANGSGAALGVVITTPGANYTNPTITTAGGATITTTLGQESGTYPSCVGYDQQRRGYGATNSLPQTLTFSQPDNFLNFDTTPVSQDTDAITATLAGRQVNYIEALVPMNTGLVVLTTGGAFLVSGGGQSAAITPSNFSALPQASSGANSLPPLVINYDVLYCQNRGAVVRDLAFNFYVQSYTGTDRSVLASHLFSTYTLIDWTWAEEPYRLVWVVRSDGKLLSMTYVPEQELCAWARHDTQGLVKYICSIPEGQENVVYLVVQRYLNGAWVNCIERFASRQWTEVEDCWFLDAAYKVPETSPNASIQLSAITGNAVTVTATSGTPFTAGDVGNILWAGGGQAQVTAYTSPTSITVEVLQPFPTVSADTTIPLPYSAGQWTYDTPTQSVGGLSWLAGQTVGIMVDGMPQPQAVVPGSGILPLEVAGTKIIVGLPYSSQFQTLRLDTGDPTIQGKRKLVTAVTLRVYQTLGIVVGPDFDSLYPVDDLVIPVTIPLELISDDSVDARELLAAQWTKEAQVCIQQNAPLPMSILGIIPEITLGDTGR
jgi:hypothetical protein